LVLGRISADAAFPGLGGLDIEAARRALDDAGVSAAGVVAVVDAAMEQAVRVMSVARGVDPRRLALVAFGGAGPLHACAIADALGMRAVVVPPRAGVLSAVGLLCSPRQRDLVRSWPTPADHDGLDEMAKALAAEAVAAVESGCKGNGDIEVTTSFDCRYAGQSHELTVSSVEAFHDEHRRRNGYARSEALVEVVAVRARARRPAPLEIADLPAPPPRKQAVGPAVMAEPDCTVWVPEGWVAEVDERGSWILTRRGRERRGQEGQ
jgi:N-methylhydantoinase A/oxoprolinase/acetone carboxylase beta subunit